MEPFGIRITCDGGQQVCYGDFGYAESLQFFDDMVLLIGKKITKVERFDQDRVAEYVREDKE